jgi:hypothetical protein
MFENWLMPPDLEALEIAPSQFADFQIGKKIQVYTSTDLLTEGGENALSEMRLAIVGIDAEEANAVRKALYPMTDIWKNVFIHDLGNVRKASSAFVVPLLKELISQEICPILIGINPAFTLAQYQCYIDTFPIIQLALIDDKIRYAPKSPLVDEFYLNTLLQLKKTPLQHGAIIGYQTHLTPPIAIETLEQKNIELLRLGKVRQNLDEVEPAVRNANLLSINLSTLKYAEAPSQLDPSVTGLSAEEACQIMRFAGMSDSVSSFGVYGFEQREETLTAQTVATLIWYFIEGFFNRKNDLPPKSSFTKQELAKLEHLVQYLVTMAEIGIELCFCRSQKTGRWWLKVPQEMHRKNEKPKWQLLAVAYADYQKACQGELSERIFNFLK